MAITAPQKYSQSIKSTHKNSLTLSSKRSIKRSVFELSTHDMNRNYLSHNPGAGLTFLLKCALRPITEKDGPHEVFMQNLATSIANGGVVFSVTEHVLPNKNVRYEVCLSGGMTLSSPECALTDTMTTNYCELLTCLSVIYNVVRQWEIDPTEAACKGDPLVAAA